MVHGLFSGEFKIKHHYHHHYHEISRVTAVMSAILDVINFELEKPAKVKAP